MRGVDSTHQGPGPAITCCVTLGRSPPFSGPQNTSLHNEGVGSLQGPFRPGEHRWAQGVGAITAALRQPTQLCFFKKDMNANRPKGQESWCQDEVSVWLLTRINRPQSCTGRALLEKHHGEVRWAGPRSLPLRHHAHRRQVTAGHQELPHSQLPVSAGGQHKAWKETPKGAKGPSRSAQPLLLTSG